MGSEIETRCTKRGEVDEMKTNMLTRVRKHFNSGRRSIDRHNQRAWVKSVRFLGTKWLLHPANNIGRKA
jgi:hypothetical protein